MSLIFSRRCEYALQAILFISSREPGKLVSIKELTKRMELPYHFLGKIFQDLAQKGILRSSKGPEGGFGLAKSADAITLLDIVEAVDGLGFMHQCVMGFPTCSSDKPCPVHDKWGSLRNEVHHMLVSKTVAELVRDTRKPELLPL